MTLNVYSINTLTLCFTYTDIGLTGKLEEVKKKKKIVPQVVILFLDMHLKYLNYNGYGFI